MKSKLIHYLVVVIAIACGDTLRATWYSENVPDGGQVIMMDLRWPWWPAGTYYAHYNTSLNTDDGSFTFYNGINSYLTGGPDGTPNPDPVAMDQYRPGQVWTFWGATSAGVPPRFVEAGDNFYIKNVAGGEGAAASTTQVNLPWVTDDQWYTMVVRAWEPPTQDPDRPVSYAGRWMKDLANSEWHFIGYAEALASGGVLGKNSGFIEPLAGGYEVVRPLHRRFGYSMKDGVWTSTNEVQIKNPSSVCAEVKSESGHEYLSIEYAQSAVHLPTELTNPPLDSSQTHTISVNQPATPALDAPVVQNVSASVLGEQVVVRWEVPVTAAPQLGYVVEAYSTDDGTGTPVATEAMNIPSRRQAIVTVPGGNIGSVKLTISDIFGQETSPVVVTCGTLGLPDVPPDPGATEPGLDFQRYTKDPASSWGELADLAHGVSSISGLSQHFDFSVAGDLTNTAIVFSGYLSVPTDGLYMFRTQIDGAYELKVGGQTVITRDAQAGTKAYTGVAALRAGLQPIELTFMYTDLPRENLNIQWEGPGFAMQDLSQDSLRVVTDASRPAVAITPILNGDGTGTVTAVVDPKGHSISRIRLYLNTRYIDQVTDGGTVASYQGALPEGLHRYWCRITLAGGEVFDSPTTWIDNSGTPPDPEWNAVPLSSDFDMRGVWQTGPDSFAFIGEGMFAIGKSMTGDFTATCRVDSYTGGSDVFFRSWVGVSARENPTARDWRWGNYFHLVQTARDGISISPENNDSGGSRLAIYRIPSGRPWLRVVRQGDFWTGWTSMDGENWEVVAHQWKPMGGTLEAGLFFNVNTKNATRQWSCSVSHFEVVSGLYPETTTPGANPATGTGGDKFTGVVMSRTDPDVIVLRSTSIGLLRTTDGGDTWTPANGALNGSQLAVRSVAIHPTDPDIMIRAGGHGADGQLWKTLDGGATWSKLPLTGNFDGLGPSALCGEVVAFDFADPQVVYAGCESDGFWVSLDGGQSWSREGLTDQRITAVVPWPWGDLNNAPNTQAVRVLTSTDEWMTYLGRGAPSVTTSATASKVYKYDDVGSLSLHRERSDTGFYNMGWHQSWQVRDHLYATTLGIQQEPNSKRTTLFNEYRGVEAYTPFTAIGSTDYTTDQARVLTMALNPQDLTRYSLGYGWWGWLWKGLEIGNGDRPAGGLIAATGERLLGADWWFVHTDGVYRSHDGGVTLEKIDLSRFEDPSGPWTPADLETSVWFDAADTATLNASGGSVSQWRDKSGNNKHTSQNTVSQQPVSGTRTINGVNALDFDNDRLVNADGMPDGDVTVFAVVNVDAIRTSFDGMIVGNNGNGSQKTRQYLNDDMVDFGNSSLGHALEATTPAILMGRVKDLGDVSTQGVRVNGGGETTATTSRGTANAMLAIGNHATADDYFDGLIGEVVMFNQELTDADRQKMEGYLAHKWGLEAELPVDHPYRDAAPWNGAPPGNRLPELDSDPVVAADGTEGVPYIGTLAGRATDADGDRLEFAKVSGPDWLSVGSDGVLSGTPSGTDVGLNTFAVSVSDGLAGTIVGAVQILVEDVTAPNPDPMSFAVLPAPRIIEQASVALVATDFTGTIVNGDTAGGIVWNTVGVEDPGDLVTDAPDGLFDTVETQGFFAPDRNVDNEGPWSVSIPLVMSEAGYRFTGVEIDYQHFSNFGLPQGAPRSVDWTFSLIGSVSGTLATETVEGASVTSGSETLALPQSIALTMEETYQLVITATGTSNGNNTGLGRLVITGGIDGGVSHTEVTMTATSASDPSGVEYLFTELSGNPGGSTSGWQGSPVYTDTGLQPGFEYTYVVQARDASSNQNATATSPPASAFLDLAVPWITTGEATGITETDVQVAFELKNDGGEAPEVILFYGETDGGRTPETWMAFQNLGMQTTGSHASTLTGLSPGTRYFFSFRAVNSAGAVWGTSDSFTTLSGFQSFMNQHATTQKGANEDPDQDGVVNLMEYAFNLNPTALDALLMPTPALNGNGRLEVTFETLRPELNYAVEGSDDLDFWSTQGIQIQNQGGDWYSYEDTIQVSENGCRYMRIKIELR